MLPTVNVWPSRYVVGWDGDRTKAPPASYPVVDFREALFSIFDTDAHFCPAIIPGATSQPRLKLTGAKPELLAEVRFTTLALDIDAPNHTATPEWWEHTVTTIQAQPLGNGIIYCTRGGIRVVYELIDPLTISEYQKIHTQTRVAYKAFGVVVDELTDWTRCYRLPFVVRDGERQNNPVYDSPNPVLLFSYLPHCEEAENIFERAARVHSLTDFNTAGASAAARMGRNQTLFRMACAFRDFKWMDEETLEVAVRAINDNFPQPLPEHEVTTLIKSAWSRYKPTRGADDIEEEVRAAEEEDKPRIPVRLGEIHLVQRDAIEALKRIPNLYVREGKLVRLVGAGLAIQELPREALPGILCQAAEFVKLKKEGEDFVEMLTDPPPTVVAGVFAAGDYPLPELRGVQRTPTLRPDGSVVSTSGYDPSTRLYNALDVTVTPESVGGTRKEAEEALQRLSALFSEFPFARDEHLSTTLAALMTPVLRPAIRGPVPLFLFDSNTPGSGKTIQADIVSLVATGHEAPRMSWTREEEVEKRITAILTMGAPVVLIDNIEPGKPLGGASLDALLTSDTWMGRKLSKTEMMVLPNNSTWLATGNNMKVKGDLVRRSLHSFLDPGMERPEERTFTIKDLRAHVLANRETILRDILTIARARHLSAFVGPSYGSFESWAYWVRDSLTWLGMADPVLTQKALRESDSTDMWRRFLECAQAVWGNKDFTPRDVQEAVMGVRKFGGPPEAYAGLSTVVSELVKDVNSIAQIGQVMQSWGTRVLGGYRLTPAPRATLRGPTYRVERPDETSALVPTGAVSRVSPLSPGAAQVGAARRP
jgi:hypothetical protein